MARCRGKTKNGAICKKNASSGEDYCYQHMRQRSPILDSNIAVDDPMENDPMKDDPVEDDVVEDDIVEDEENYSHNALRPVDYPASTLPGQFPEAPQDPTPLRSHQSPVIQSEEINTTKPRSHHEYAHPARSGAFYTLSESTLEAIRTKLPEIEEDIVNLQLNYSELMMATCKEKETQESMLTTLTRLANQWKNNALKKWELAERGNQVARSQYFWDLRTHLLDDAREIEDPGLGEGSSTGLRAIQEMTSHDYERLLQLGITREQDLKDNFDGLEKQRREVEKQSRRRQSF